MEIKEIYIKFIGNKSYLITAILLAALLFGAAGLYIANRGGGIIIETSDAGTNAASTTSSNADGAEDEGDRSAGSGEMAENGSSNTVGGVDNMNTDDKGNLNAPDKNNIQVYIVGCVNNQGLVTLKKGQLVSDAINAAGGPTEDADIYNINLAYKLYDNVMIRIKSIYDVSQASGEGSFQTQGSNGIEMIYDSGGAVADEDAGSESVSGTGGSSCTTSIININTASAAQLETLPGIGTETAKDIIAYREKSGGFIIIEDIMKVPGIKESRFSKLKDYITVGN